ncbi:LA_2272 family surface repeat-containing protein [Bdellovibrio sp. HCB185ZH]|uniref:LA_2272 family surface repeat-containing protein n=1 Tax=Bdellovibrio sp. HCB185ZH TaxID=3394235 RepID=UPI0039A75BFB
MKKNIFLSLIFAIVCSTSASFAAVTPISVSIAPPVQFPPQDFSITGIRLSALWGHHRDVYGLDFGVLGNITDQDFVGIGIAGGFNATYGSTNIIGLQLAGLGNYNQQKTNVVGLQAAIISNINVAESNVYGVQLAVTNLSNSTSVYGAQLGIYNRAKSVYGIQLGLVNITDNLHGLQIGLVNFNHTGVFKVSPILNVGF